MLVVSCHLEKRVFHTGVMFLFLVYISAIICPFIGAASTGRSLWRWLLGCIYRYTKSPRVSGLVNKGIEKNPREKVMCIYWFSERNPNGCSLRMREH